MITRRIRRTRKTRRTERTRKTLGYIFSVFYLLNFHVELFSCLVRMKYLWDRMAILGIYSFEVLHCLFEHL